MTLSDLGKGKQIVKGDNQPSAERYFIHELYAFREVLSQEEKKALTLESFFTTRLLPFVQVKKGDTELLQQGYRAFLTSDRLTNYCNTHNINRENISMSQAWSIFHVLMGEEVWNEIEAQLTDDSIEKREFQSARKLAELHHTAEGVFVEKVSTLSETEIKQLGVIILIDKIQSYWERMPNNFVLLHGKQIHPELQETLQIQSDIDYFANNDVIHINTLINSFQNSDFPEKIKEIFLSLLERVYPLLLRRTECNTVEEIRDHSEEAIENIIAMIHKNPQKAREIIHAARLRLASNRLIENGSLENNGVMAERRKSLKETA